MSAIAIKNDGYPVLAAGMKVRRDDSTKDATLVQCNLLVNECNALRAMWDGCCVVSPVKFDVFRHRITHYSTDNGATWLPYRRAEPEPEYVRFTAETFPPLHQCELRYKSNGDRYAIVAAGAGLGGPRAGEFRCRVIDTALGGQSHLTPEELLERYEIRINDGEWQPCGKRK